MRSHVAIPVGGPEVAKRSVLHARETIVSGGIVAVATEAEDGVEDGGLRGGARVGDPVPVHGCAGISAFVEGIFVDLDEVAVPREKGGLEVNWVVLISRKWEGRVWGKGGMKQGGWDREKDALLCGLESWA